MLVWRLVKLNEKIERKPEAINRISGHNKSTTRTKLKRFYNNT